MKIITATTRIAIVGKWYTLKIARVPVKAATQELIGIARDYYHDRNIGKLRIKLSEHQGPFRGIWANWREWSHSFSLGENVVSTRFSLLGIVNIIDTAVSLLETHPARFIQQSLGGKDAHTFQETANYGWHRGRLKLLDYGSLDAIRYLHENAEKFRRELDAFGQVFVNRST
jgi:hypothetical protein